MSNAIATNAAANSAVSFLSRNSEMQSSSIAKLSSGSRIVKASDDAASLAVGTKLKADVTALKQASTNADQASSLLQVADGALSRVGDTLMRMKSLATQARSDALTNTERGYLNEEFSQMKEQIDFISTSTKFNDTQVISGALGTDFDTLGGIMGGGLAELRAVGGQNDNDVYTVENDANTITLNNTTSGASQTVAIDGGVTDDFTQTVTFESLGMAIDFNGADISTTNLATGTDTFTIDNSGGAAATFQVGVAAGTDDITVNIAKTDATELGVAGDSINSIAAAETASNNLDTAIETVNTERAQLGANMSRMEKISENIATTTENLDAARSVLMDVDVAAEMTEFSKNQVMTQASTAMLAQANQLPQNLMRLLQ